MVIFLRTLLLLTLVISSSVFAFPCYLTVVKDNCWTNYDVTVTMSNLQTNAKVSNVLVPKGKSWERQQFTCDAGQTLTYYATFQPVIWENQANTAYKAVSFWTLPTTIGAHDLAWNLTACFPRDFSSTPTPINATGNCSCDVSDIPEPKPTP